MLYTAHSVLYISPARTKETPMAQYDLTDLVTRINAIGGDLADLLALRDVEDLTGRVAGTGVIAWNRTAQTAAYELVERMESRAPRRTSRATTPAPAAAPKAPRGDLATDRQVAYAVRLIGQRMRNGDGGGFVVGGYPTADQLARMSRRSISTLIDSLSENY
jgi:hypothetical protein